MFLFGAKFDGKKWRFPSFVTKVRPGRVDLSVYIGLASRFGSTQLTGMTGDWGGGTRVPTLLKLRKLRHNGQTNMTRNCVED